MLTRQPASSRSTGPGPISVPGGEALPTAACARVSFPMTPAQRGQEEEGWLSSQRSQFPTETQPLGAGAE